VTPPLRTSADDPLRVDFLPRRVLGAPGRLGLTIAPGKRDRRRGWLRDLDADLRRLRRSYHTGLLVSLLEEPERAMLGIPDLLERARAHRLEVRALPVRDVSVPRPDQLDAARALVHDIVAAVDAGRTVVVHCRGGLGRSGLIAASVLVARGVAADLAIAAVRDARPSAIETTEQEAWVRAFARRAPPGDRRPDDAPVIDATHIRLGEIPPPHPASPDAPPVDRLVGCLLGGALGDALGYPVEFVGSHDKIVAQHGAEPPRRLAYVERGGLISDDTQMTLFVAEGLIRARQRRAERGTCDPHAVGMGALLRWYATQTGGAIGRWPGWLVRDRRMHAQRAPGQTNLAALAALAARRDDDSPAAGPARNHSKGCGAVMRAAPFGFLPDRDQAFEHAVVNARLTHGHPTGALAAGYLAALVHDLARGVALPDACDRAGDLLAARPDHEETSRAVDRARTLAANFHRLDGEHLERLGGGWVAEEALAIALACVLTHRTDRPRAVERTLWRAACHGGDSDSTAAIAGNLLGAMLGAAALPAAWLAELELRDAIERLARDLWTSLHEGRFLDVDDYPPN
jgi:ADP-ribosyl-[dinitrogen reductase] hydrolase